MTLILCVCVFPTSDYLENVEVIIVKLGTETASNMIMYHMLFILTLTLTQGHILIMKTINV